MMTHYVSMHVIYHTTCISSNDLITLTKRTDELRSDQRSSGFIYNINDLVDVSAYSLAKRQLFRYVLSDKIFKVNDERNKSNHGLLANKAKPSQHIV